MVPLPGPAVPAPGYDRGVDDNRRPMSTEPEPRSPASLQPLLVEAVGEPEVAAAGSMAIAAMMRATEEQVSALLGEARRSAAELESDTEVRARLQTAERREELAQLRRELTDSASSLALRFEGLLDLIELAEAELARCAGLRPPPWRAHDDRVEAIRMTVRERRRITFAQEATAPGTPDAAQPAAEAAEPKRRRRWWKLWLRDAA